jgi:lactoylglutathione lyase
MQESTPIRGTSDDDTLITLRQLGEVCMKLCWVTINVKDMDASLKFYTEIVGLTVDRMMKPNPKMQIAFLGSGETKVELICDPKPEALSYGKDISIGFEVASLDEMMETLKAKGVKIESGPFQPNPRGARFAFTRDPDGMRVQFVENIPR